MTSSFDFDAPEHQQKTLGTPSIKVLNESAAFFIADDNLEKVSFADRTVGEAYKQKTSQIGEDDRPLYINGIAIANPRVLVLDESPLLVRNKKTRKFIGIYDADSYKPADEQAYRIYQVVLLDKDSKPLHEETLQLTATGHFGVNWNTQLEKFREECIQAYNKFKGFDDNNKRVIRWHSFWIFQPKMKPEKKGRDDTATSFACVTTGFISPDSTQLGQVNIAMNPDLKDFTGQIAELQLSTQDSWLQRVKKSSDNYLTE
jgi:Family of unknown function (DUF5895)